MKVIAEIKRERWGRKANIEKFIKALGSNTNKPSDRQMRTMLNGVAASFSISGFTKNRGGLNGFNLK